MKKLLALMLALAMVLCCSACGSNDESAQDGKDQTAADNNNAEKNQEKNNSIFDSDEITVEDLMNREANPESDFTCEDYGDGILVLTGYLGSDEIVVIPETWNGMPIEVIDGYVFSNESPVRAIRLANSIKVIDDSAFALNASLEIVVCGSGLEEIGGSAFLRCENLREIVFNDGLVTLGSYCFSGCSSLASVEIPDSVTSIDPVAFFPATEGFTIIGTAGSAAELHAISEGITFQEK